MIGRKTDIAIGLAVGIIGLLVWVAPLLYLDGKDAVRENCERAPFGMPCKIAE